MNKQQFRFMIFTILILLTVACNPGLDDTPLETAASFGVSSQEGEAPLKVRFTRKTVEIPYWLWEFGDGTTFSSTDSTSNVDMFRFSHEYEEPGAYEVRFTVRDESSEESTATKTIVVNERAKVNANSIRIRRYRGLSSRYFDDNTNDNLKRIRYNTEIGDENSICGIIGFQAQGQIGKTSGGSSGGKIHGNLVMMDLYMEAVDGDWFINAVFESEYGDNSSKPQLWDIDVLCVGNSVFERGGAKYIAYYTGGGAGYRIDLEYDASQDLYVADTGVSAEDFYCGVVGFAFQEALYTPSPPYFLKAKAITEANGYWGVLANFRDTSITDNTLWTRMNVLCLTKVPDVNFEFIQARLPHEETGLYSRSIGLTGEDYNCGVFGFAVEGGKLKTSGNNQIMMMARMVPGSVWSVQAHIPRPSNNDMENWELDLVCLGREYILWDIIYDCSSGSCILDEQ